MLASIFAALAPQLKTVHLADNGLGDGGVAALSSTLGCCSRLQRIALNSNAISSDGIRVLSAPLRCLTSLTALDLRDNRLGSADGLTLSDTVPFLARLCPERRCRMRLEHAHAHAHAQPAQSAAWNRDEHGEQGSGVEFAGVRLPADLLVHAGGVPRLPFLRPCHLRPLCHPASRGPRSDRARAHTNASGTGCMQCRGGSGEVGGQQLVQELELDLSSRGLGPADVLVLRRIAGEVPNVRALLLQGNPLGAQGFAHGLEFAAPAAAGMEEHWRVNGLLLRHINVTRCALGPSGATLVSAAMRGWCVEVEEGAMIAAAVMRCHAMAAVSSRRMSRRMCCVHA